jgi:hypothetical protein
MHVYCTTKHDPVLSMSRKQHKKFKSENFGLSVAVFELKDLNFYSF